MDPMMDVKSKEIKRNCLTELIDYVTTNKNVLQDAVYPEIVKMVKYFIKYAWAEFLVPSSNVINKRTVKIYTEMIKIILFR